MDRDVFREDAQRQHSQNSAAPLATPTQFEERAGAPSGSESISPNPVATSFSSRDEGEGSSHSSRPLPPVPQDITPLGSQAVHPDPRTRPLSVLRTMSVGQQNRLDWTIPREENSEKVSLMVTCVDIRVTRSNSFDRQPVNERSGNASILPS
jgi:hypothetical protein